MDLDKNYKSQTRQLSREIREILDAVNAELHEVVKKLEDQTNRSIEETMRLRYAQERHKQLAQELRAALARLQKLQMTTES